MHDDEFIDLQITDLTAIPGAQQTEAIERLMLDDTQRVFDLETDPTLRLHLVRLSEREHVLLRVMSPHCLGWLVEQHIRGRAVAAYGAFVRGASRRCQRCRSSMPTMHCGSASGCRVQLLERQLGYWKSKLADLPTLELPTDRPRPPVVSHRGAHAPSIWPRR